jgi:hypothetical protein
MEGVTNVCGNCGRRIPEDHEVFSLGAKAHPGMLRKDEEGTAIRLTLAYRDEPLAAIVVPSDAPAKRDGYDLVFVACSPKCAKALKRLLQREMHLISDVGSVH